MKLQKTIMTASILIATGYVGVASAHSQAGAVGLAGSGLAKTDVYVVSCFDGGDFPGVVPTRLHIEVLDKAPVKLPLVSIQATKGTASSTLSTDAVDGNTAYSPVATLAGGAGDYTLKVNKSAYTGTVATHKGPETYVARFHCEDNAGNHAGTEWIMTQNQ
ncbi:hypothetical protein [Methyloglobulus sp.]|uniref:hypothetical protein n=1 Tax=Methyloglobulus sp. TaxID=2518622 RepID=UPI0032B88296